ncbi:MAG TPA: nucleoside monophosphate kinase [Fibrobacteraceae bacterium]|nr:nucleoside monophosphate kinase [Fibrobacteraceae bacterium]
MNKYQAFLIFGPPGSGKGTVGSKLAQTTTLKHLSTGDIFRGLSPASESGQLFFRYANAGNLVPDEATVDIFSRYLRGLVDTNKLDPTKDILLLDGIPRTAAQAKLIEPVVDVMHAFVLEIQDHNTVIQRILNRAKIEGRKDDADESVIRNRISEYLAKTAAVLDHYSTSQITRINGSQTPDEVFRDTLSAVIDVRQKMGR